MKYLTTIDHVREVALIGAADPGYWRERLSRERLAPYDYQGAAQVLINAVQLRWLGLTFRELVITVRVTAVDCANAVDSYFLLQGYNTNQLLALAEQIFFETPYVHGEIVVDMEHPVRIRHGAALRPMFHARKAAGALPTFVDESFEGRVYVAGGKYYQVRLSGVAECSLFREGKDMFEYGRVTGEPVYDSLRDSGFRAVEWRIRRDGTHARGATLPV